MRTAIIAAVACSLAASATMTAAHAGQYQVGQEVRFHAPAPACRDENRAQYVQHYVLRFAAANNVSSAEALAQSYLWDQVKDFVYSHEGCTLLDSGEWYKIVQAGVGIDFCLITTHPLDVRSPEEVAKETPAEKATAEQKYCYWTGLPANGRW